VDRNVSKPTIEPIKNTLLDELADPPRPRRDPGPGSNAKMPENHSFKTLHCSHCGHALKVRLSCGDRTCPECRRKWFGYHFKTLLDCVRTWKRPYFLTLTIKNIPDYSFGRYNVRELREAFGKLRRRFKRIAGGFYVVQATNYGRGWHLHLHVIFDGKFILKEVISKAWAEITAGSYIIDIKEVYSSKEAVRYLLSDFLQAPRIRPEDKETFNAVFRGSRLIQPFGEYRKIKFRIPYKCPSCGRVEWVDLDYLLGKGRGWQRCYEEDS